MISKIDIRIKENKRHNNQGPIVYTMELLNPPNDVVGLVTTTDIQQGYNTISRYLKDTGVLKRVN